MIRFRPSWLFLIVPVVFAGPVALTSSSDTVNPGLLPANTDSAAAPAPPEESGPSAANRPLTGKIIVLDPGHAVRDVNHWLINPGAAGRRGVSERDVVLEVADKMVPLLESQGARVFLTRTKGNPWRYSLQGRQADNRARAVFANIMHADAYVRLHCDWNRNKKFKGFTTYYYRWGSRRLAKSLDKALVDALPKHKNHGLHRRSFVSVTTTMPAVLLELGVLSNREEVKDLGSENYQTRLAAGVSAGIVEYFSKARS